MDNVSSSLFFQFCRSMFSRSNLGYQFSLCIIPTCLWQFFFVLPAGTSIPSWRRCLCLQVLARIYFLQWPGHLNRLCFTLSTKSISFYAGRCAMRVAMSPPARSWIYCFNVFRVRGGGLFLAGVPKALSVLLNSYPVLAGRCRLPRDYKAVYGRTWARQLLIYRRVLVQ